jgi:hypothetical protein
MEGNYITAIILAVLYHIVLLPFLASYWQIVWTKPGLVPGSHHLSSHDIDVIESSSQPHMALETLIATKDLAVATRSMQGEIRYCSECSHIKVICGHCIFDLQHLIRYRAPQIHVFTQRSLPLPSSKRVNKHIPAGFAQRSLAGIFWQQNEMEK